MGGEARTDDQHAVVTQRPQPLAEAQKPRRIQGGQRDLQHRDVGLRIHHRQRYIGTVVEPAIWVVVHRFGVGHERLDVRGESGAPGAA